MEKSKIQTFILIVIHLIPIIFFLTVFPFSFSGTLFQKIAFSLCGTLFAVYIGKDLFNQIGLYVSDEGIINKNRLFKWDTFEGMVNIKGSYLIFKCKNMKKSILVHKDLYGNNSTLTAF